MENKILRFLELSQEFTINPKEIFGDNSQSNFIASGSAYYTISLNETAQQVSKARLEVLTEKLQGEISKAERFEEYLALRDDLLGYYQALNKLKST